MVKKGIVRANTTTSAPHPNINSSSNNISNRHSSCLCKEIETVFSYRLQDAFQRGLGESEW